MSRPGIVSTLKKKKITDLIASGKRMDGRGLEDIRNVVIKTGVLEKADGSAEVYLGNTRVMVGVKIDTGRPFEDTPDKGVLMCNAEFTPVASPFFDPGPPGEDSIELARIVDRGLRSAEVLDFSKLCLVPGKLVNLVHVDIYVLNFDGNLIDASSLAAVAALKTSKTYEYNVEGEKVTKNTEKKVELELVKEPIAVTMVKIGESFVVDPSADEEEVQDDRITITYDEDDNICTIQKSGSNGISVEEVKSSIEMGLKKSIEYRKKFEEYMNG
jgi:exosome complex component RRP42